MNYCIQLLSKRVFLPFTFAEKLENLNFFLKFVFYKKQTSGLSNTLFHAYLLGLIRSLINSSMTKSPSDEDAMQIYLKQIDA